MAAYTFYQNALRTSRANESPLFCALYLVADAEVGQYDRLNHNNRATMIDFVGQKMLRIYKNKNIPLFFSRLKLIKF